MIKINKSYSSEFIKRYLDYALNEVIGTNLEACFKSAPIEIRVQLSDFFCLPYLRTLVTAKAENLESIIEDIYDAFPQLAERYCYSYLLKHTEPFFESLTEALSAPATPEIIDDAVKNALVALRSIGNGMTMPFTDELVIQLSTPGTARHKKKRLLTRLLVIKTGRHKFSKKSAPYSHHG